MMAIDLFSGLGGWTRGFLAEGWDCYGFDNERHRYFVPPIDGKWSYGNAWDEYPAQLILQDVLTIHGKQFRNADIIVASPPCQEFSYMAMPWRRGKQIATALNGEGDFPAEYKGSRTVPELRALFDACFRIQREASEAARRHIPLIVENVRGAQRWVGPAAWNYGSFYLWGDVPALMPKAFAAPKVPGFRFDGSGRSLKTAAVEGCKVPSEAGRRTAPGNGARFTTRDCGAERKQPVMSSKSSARKEASARIAMIPLELSRYIARVFEPEVAA